MLILLVICCVSPSTFHVIAAVCTMVNMTWVGTLVVFRGVGAWRLRSASSINRHSFLEEEPVTHFVVLPNFQKDEATFREPLKILAALLRQRDACTSVLAVEAREGPSNQDRAGRLVAATGHLLQDMTATYHPYGIAGEVACTQWAFPTALEEMRTSPARPQECVHGEMLTQLHQQCVHGKIAENTKNANSFSRFRDPLRVGLCFSTSRVSLRRISWQSRLLH